MKIASTKKTLTPSLALVLAAILGAIMGSAATAAILRAEAESMSSLLSAPR